MEGVLISTCGMWNAGDSQGMDGSNRGPWFGPGAILITGADLYDTPNGEPPETTAQDVAADSGDFGFSYDLWLDLHPLRCVDAGLTCSAEQKQWYNMNTVLAPSAGCYGPAVCGAVLAD